MFDYQRNVFYQPGIILSFFLIGLAVLIWPDIIERVIPLTWKIGDMRPVVYALQAILVVLAVISFRKKDRIKTLRNRLFQDRKTFVFTMIGSILALSITLAIMEAALRILDLPYKASWTPQEYYRVQFDPEIGWVYVPNKSTNQQFLPGYPEIPLYSDSIGSRVGTPGLWHDPIDPTVIFVGGSFTYGYGLPYEETLPGKLESMPGFPYQVVNLGVEAYGTDQALLLLKRHFSKFNTKVVVYTFISNHIERNNNYDRRMLFRSARFVGTKPLFGLTGEGTLCLRKEPRKYEELTEFRVWSFVQFAWTQWGPKSSIENIGYVGESFTTDGQFQQAVDLTQNFILEMNEFVESQGAEFILLYWNYGGENHDNQESSHGIVWSMLEDIDIEVIDISRNAPSDWGWEAYTFPGDAHPNGKANAIVAQLLFEELSQRGLLIPDNITKKGKLDFKLYAACK